jgi:tetratricopeptide (TPR) repeat protein
MISLRLGDKERAAREYTEYIAALKAESAPLGTDNKTPNIALAEALLAGGLPDEAKQELESSLLNDSKNIEALILLSKVYLQKKNIQAAGRLLESAVAGGLDDAKIYLALAEVYEAGGYPENAIPAMRRAIAKEPKNDFYRSRYGLLLVNSKAPAAAIVRIEEALKEFPDSPSLWFALGIAQFDNNKIPEAGQAFEKALAIDSKSVPALAYLGAVFVEQTRYADAVRIYEQAIGLNDKVALLYYLLGDTLLKMTEADEKRVETALRRAAELDRNLTSAHTTLGRLYVRQSRWTEAAASLEQAAKLEPDRAETFYQLGRVYARLKRTNESKATLERFKQLNDSQKQQKEVDRRELVRRLANVRF